MKWFDVKGMVLLCSTTAKRWPHHHHEGFRPENEEVEFDTVVDDRTGKLRRTVTGPDGACPRKQPFRLVR